jgi:branched-chain amino acid transport system substrate-binding protein
MTLRTRYHWLIGLALAALATTAAVAADKQYGPGVTDTEIKIGQTMPYSGPASSFGTVGRTSAAYYRMINDQGGVNGRKINFLSPDNEYSPTKSAELARRLVEQDQVLGIFGSLGTPTNVAMQRYLNDRKVPQFFVFSGVARFRDPHTYPWTIGGDLAFINETKAFARYILETKPDAKIGVLYQNDDFGKDHIIGLKQGLGEKNAGMIVKTVAYEVTDPTLDSQIITLQQSGADVVLLVTLPKFAALSIRKIHDIGWKPLILLAYPGASIPGALKPAGLEASTGVVTAEFVRQPGDPAWASDPQMTTYLAFMKKYAPDLDATDKLSVFGYYNAAMVVGLLKQCGDNLTRENLLEQATHLHDVTVPMLLPGIVLNTTPEDYAAIKQMQLLRFDGTGWVNIGSIVGG